MPAARRRRYQGECRRVGQGRLSDYFIELKTGSLPANPNKMNTRLHKDFFLRLLNPPGLLLAVISVFIFSQQRAFSQQSVDTAHNAVNWEFSAQKGADGNPVLVLHANIRNGWKLYSTTNPDTVGNSRVSLDSSAAAKILSIEEKGALQRKKDPIFNGTITSFFTGDAQIGRASCRERV